MALGLMFIVRKIIEEHIEEHSGYLELLNASKTDYERRESMIHMVFRVANKDKKQVLPVKKQVNDYGR
ncbi:MAG: Nitrogen regulation protein [Candidatus Tokpelaia sp. JSC189]|nr:MAG: Nitrogen regulation protein [Candidatus Tokpelaia sp. JSC189]